MSYGTYQFLTENSCRQFSDLRLYKTKMKLHQQPLHSVFSLSSYDLLLQSCSQRRTPPQTLLDCSTGWFFILKCNLLPSISSTPCNSLQLKEKYPNKLQKWSTNESKATVKKKKKNELKECNWICRYLLMSLQLTVASSRFFHLCNAKLTLTNLNTKIKYLDC